jgi:hypothetical protein
VPDTPEGGKRGQPGWDVGIPFNNSQHLFEQLVTRPVSQLAGRKISKLAIVSHGEGGRFLWNGDKGPDLTPETLESFRAQFVALNRVLTPTAPVFFMGCSVGRGDRGSQLLQQVSAILTGHKVVGITTIGHRVSSNVRHGGNCTEPGLQDTNNYGEGRSDDDYKAVQASLPWTTENSPHAKIALGGKIVQFPEEDVGDHKSAEELFVLPDYLYAGTGRWLAEIGNPGQEPAWTGVFAFEKGNAVSWASRVGAPQHRGTWRIVKNGAGDAVQFSFSDDARNFERTFTTTPPFGPNNPGTIKHTRSGAAAGFFRILKVD